MILTIQIGKVYKYNSNLVKVINVLKPSKGAWGPDDHEVEVTYIKQPTIMFSMIGYKHFKLKANIVPKLIRLLYE